MLLQDATIDELFRLLEQKTGIPPDQARLIHAGKELEQKGKKLISDYPSVVHGSTMFMVMRLLGGRPNLLHSTLCVNFCN